MEEYLDKIHDLESGNKSIATLTKKIGVILSLQFFCFLFQIKEKINGLLATALYDTYD